MPEGEPRDGIADVPPTRDLNRTLFVCDNVRVLRGLNSESVGLDRDHPVQFQTGVQRECVRC